jgi:hypothetical protein
MNGKAFRLTELRRARLDRTNTGRSHFRRLSTFASTNWRNRMTVIATACLVVALATFVIGRLSWSLMALLAALLVLSPFTLLLFLLVGGAALYFLKLH